MGCSFSYTACSGQLLDSPVPLGHISSSGRSAELRYEAVPECLFWVCKDFAKVCRPPLSLYQAAQVVKERAVEDYVEIRQSLVIVANPAPRCDRQGLRASHSRSQPDCEHVFLITRIQTRPTDVLLSPMDPVNFVVKAKRSC